MQTSPLSASPPQHHHLQNDTPSLFRSGLQVLGKHCFEQFQFILQLYFEKKKKKKSTFHLASSLLYKLSDKSGNSNLGLRKSDMISL